MKVRATLTLKNEVLLAARERLGLTQKQAAQRARVPYPFVQAVERLRAGPGREGRRTWSDDTFLRHLRSLSKALGVPDGEIAFEEALGLQVEPVSVVVEMPTKALANFAERTAKRLALPPEIGLSREEITGSLNKALRKLSFRTREIVRMRSEGMTLDEIAGVFRITRERVRSIEAKGIRRLQEDRVLTASIDPEDVS